MNRDRLHQTRRAAGAQDPDGRRDGRHAPARRRVLQGAAKAFEEIAAGLDQVAKRE